MVCLERITQTYGFFGMDYTDIVCLEWIAQTVCAWDGLHRHCVFGMDYIDMVRVEWIT